MQRRPDRVEGGAASACILLVGFTACSETGNPGTCAWPVSMTARRPDKL
jgi:hypothetical protein